MNENRRNPVVIFEKLQTDSKQETDMFACMCDIWLCCSRISVVVQLLLFVLMDGRLSLQVARQDILDGVAIFAAIVFLITFATAQQDIVKVAVLMIGGASAVCWVIASLCIM